MLKIKEITKYISELLKEVYQGAYQIDQNDIKEMAEEHNFEIEGLKSYQTYYLSKIRINDFKATALLVMYKMIGFNKGNKLVNTIMGDYPSLDGDEAMCIIMDEAGLLLLRDLYIATHSLGQSGLDISERLRLMTLLLTSIESNMSPYELKLLPSRICEDLDFNSIRPIRGYPY